MTCATCMPYRTPKMLIYSGLLGRRFTCFSKSYGTILMAGNLINRQNGMSSLADTNRATTFLTPAFSKSISNLSPSIPMIAP